MEIAVFLLLFIVYSTHNFFIDKSKIALIDAVVNEAKFPWVALFVVGTAFLAYIGLWLWLCATFTVFVRSWYEFTRFEVIYDIGALIVLLFISFKMLYIANIEGKIK